ncbi:hypothetical protein CNY89_24045, partial [Amaricoccus sp. HAR-UPW-R2A-40]
MNRSVAHPAATAEEKRLHPLQALLAQYRSAARTEREKGTYFERLTIAFLEHDPIQVEQYDGIWTYAEWAKKKGWDGRDTGIDLVAKLRHEQ